MTQQVTNNQVVDIFKRVYGGLNKLVPTDQPLSKELPFSEGQKVGDRFVEAAVLSNEVGWTLAGTGQDAFDINPAISGTVKQSEIIPSQTLLSSVIPFAFMARGAGGGDVAFFDSTRYLMENHINSHERLLEMMRLYGQSDELMGYVSYAPSGTVYRGATYSGAGNITLTRSDSSTIAFTAGINTAPALTGVPDALGAILLAPGQYAAGLWVGLEGARVKQVDANSVVVAEGALVATDADLGIVYVNFTPIAASSVTSHRLAFHGQEDFKEMVGIHKILTNAGSLFGISAARYALWKANVLNCQNKRWNIRALQVGVAQAVNRGGLDKPLLVLCNPRTFSNMVSDESALRKYDASYKPASQNGFETVEWYAPNGLNVILPHRVVKEGQTIGICKPDWVRSGSAQIGFKIPGMDREIIMPLQDSAGFIVRSWADQFLFCRRPARQILWTNCNDEGVAFS